MNFKEELKKANDSKFRSAHEIWNQVHEVLGDIYNDKKVELYLVGGCVRDLLLGYPADDFDFCTNLLPDEVEELVKKAGKHVYAVGKKHGTIGFKVQYMEYNDYDFQCGWGPQWHAMGRSIKVEVTTYRGEKYIPGSRKPEVTFSDSLAFDLSRRDFTINAMALTFEKDKPVIIDKYASQLDLHEGVIKAVGDCKQRFTDDPLRILRAIRFANKYDFKLENNLKGLLKKMRNKLFNVSVERWVQELDKILMSANPDKGIDLLRTTGVLDIILPEVTHNNIYSRLTRTNNLDKRWKMLLENTGTTFSDEIEYEDEDLTIYKSIPNPQLTNYINRGICARLKFSNARTKIILGGNK